MKTHQSTTYDLIMESESEDKGRTIIETLIYVAFVLSAVVSIFQFAVQPVVMPGHASSKPLVAPIEQAG